MRVGIIQSCYIPWRGYFDFIASVDRFVIYDDVQYSKGSWRNRNQVKTPRGLVWLTVPVSVKGWPAIDEVPIRPEGKSWQNLHRELLHESLAGTPCFEQALSLWEAGIGEPTERLSLLNRRLIECLCTYLNISTPLLNSRDYQLHGSGTERLLDLLNQIGADCYVSGPSASNYLNEDLFRAAGIRLEYKSYDYEPYPQLHGEFEGAVTILDLIANLGPESVRYLQSRTPNVVAVP